MHVKIADISQVSVDSEVFPIEELYNEIDVFLTDSTIIILQIAIAIRFY